MSILEKVKKQMEKQANVMEGRTKGEIKELTAYLIKDFTILKDKDTGNEYSAFIVEGNDEEFFFGGSVVTDKLKRICDMLTDEELAELKKEGLPVMFVGKKSKNKRKLMIEEFSVDLNQQCLNGDIDPVIGRDNEINRVIVITLYVKKIDLIIRSIFCCII